MLVAFSKQAIFSSRDLLGVHFGVTSQKLGGAETGTVKPRPRTLTSIVSWLVCALVIKVEIKFQRFACEKAYIYMLGHFAVQQKLTEHWKSTIIEKKKVKKIQPL